MSYRDSGYSVRDLGIEPDEYIEYLNDPERQAEAEAGDPDLSDRYDDDSTGTFADYDPRIDYPERYTDGPI